MLEKDIENLLAKHIEDFLPNRKLVLIGQQVSLGNYRADIVFQEGFNTKLVMEIKRGILTRGAIGQIAVYYGHLRQLNPNEKIKPMLVANVIPKEMMIFMKEKMGIQSLELPVSKIKQIAEKYKYHFEDSDTPEQRSKNKQAIEDFSARAHKCRVWIFQANPQRFDILNALADERLIEDVWMVNQYKNEIKQGDIGLVWMSGKEAGIYAMIDIISNPDFLVESPISAQYWIGEKDKMQRRLRVKYKYKIKFPNSPIYRQELKNIPKLSNMAIFRQSRGTNFPVIDEEWKVISDFIKRRYG